MKPLISLCLITKNEEQNIYRCLKSVVQTVDEIIVIDTGSSDNTVKIAKEIGANVKQFVWNDNFSDARNAALALATGEWILIMDADEELALENPDTLIALLKNSTIDGYFIKILNFIGENNWQECCPDLVFRLFRNNPKYRFHGAIHEQIADTILKENQTAKFEIMNGVTLYHYGYLNEQIDAKDKKNRNLTIIEQELNIEPGNLLLRYHYGVELYRAEQYHEAAQNLIKAAQGLDEHTIYFPKLLRYIVLAYYGARELTLALEYVNIALQFYPDYVDLYYYGGLINYELQEYASAWTYFNKALTMPAQPPYYASFYGLAGFRCYYYLGQIAEKFCNEEEALRYYIASLRDNPSFVMALEKITSILDPLKNPIDTKESLEKICDFCTPQACFQMANILFSLSAFEIALEYFERGLNKDSILTNESKLWKAICLIQVNRNLEALSLLESINSSDTLYPLAKLNSLLCFLLEENHKKVLSIAEELFSLGLNDDTSQVLQVLINPKIMQQIDLSEESMNLFLDIIDRLIGIGAIEKSKKFLACLGDKCLSRYAERIGNMYVKYDIYQQAEAYFERSLKVKPNNDQIYLCLGEIKQNQNLNWDAIFYYRQALVINGKEPKYYLKLIKVLAKVSKEMKDKANKEFSMENQLLPLFEEV